MNIGPGQSPGGPPQTATGSLIWWPFDPDLNLTSNGFQFEALLNYANAQLSAAPPNTVIYVHCDSGVNRTGTFAIGYLMLWGSSLYPTMSQNLGDLGLAIVTAPGMSSAGVPEIDFYPALSGFSQMMS